MTDLATTLMTGLLGLGTGIFATLSLIEKPIWPMLRAPLTLQVGDDEVRKVHAILKRLIHLLPPTMMTTMGGVSLMMIILFMEQGASIRNMLVSLVFFSQLILIVARLFEDIRGVDMVDSDGDIGSVRNGLAALALLHHRGLLMTSSTLILIWLFAAL
ncbi:hypothetical protein [Hoeflea sp.]|uniref:hypothetical protein n=1 Tax=Hoeflea sp. TaxID=1940281 RepID=UPI003B519E53